MRSGGSPHPLARRLARVARCLPMDHTGAWRAYLAGCFAGAEYDAVRDELIAALCSDSPAYNFTGTRDGHPAIYLCGWWNRDRGGRPYVRVIVGMDADAWEAI